MDPRLPACSQVTTPYHSVPTGKGRPPHRKRSGSCSIPGSTGTPDLAGQQSALRTLYAHGQRGAEAVRALDEITEQLGALSERLAALAEDHPGGALSGAVDSLTARVHSVRESLARDDSERPGSEAVLSKIQGIYGQIARSTNGPTVPQAEWVEEFASELDAVLQEVEQVLEVEVPRLNDRIRDAGVTFIGSG